MPDAPSPSEVARTRELRAAHDVLAEVYAERLAGLLDEMPIERALLGLWAELVKGADIGADVADIGCGTGRLAPYVASRGFTPHGVDLSPEMVRVARRDYPGYAFEVADLRRLPFDDARMAGAIAWYSLMYLHPDERQAAFDEVARVLAPGGCLAMAYKQGDDQLRRGGQTLNLGIGFDIWWMSAAEVEHCLTVAGLQVVFAGQRPADPDEIQPQGYLIARKPTQE